jgi:branched-chain amino acid transport system permease protein
METLIQLSLSGLGLGFLYAIVSLGFVIIYRSSQVLNFAHGELVTAGAFFMVSFAAAGLPWGLAFLLTLATTGVLAATIERTILRGLVGRPVFITIIMTLFIGLLLRIAITLIWDVSPRGMPTPWEATTTVDIFGAKVLLGSLAAIATGLSILLIFFLIQRYTTIGVAMRATSLDQEASLALGIPVGRVFGVTWFLAGTFGAAGGVFLGMFPNSVDTNLGFFAFRAFPAIIVGGLESPSGALLAGLTLGILEVFTQTYINPLLGDFGHDFHVVFPYLVMIAFMTFRPYGIFGRREVRRV